MKKKVTKRLKAGMITGIACIVILLCILPVFNSAESSELTSFQPRVIRGFNSTNVQGIERASQQLKANALRYYLEPRKTAANYHVSVKEGWQISLDNLEIFLKEAARNGATVIIDLHEVPFEGNYTQNSKQFWDDQNNLQIIIDCWKEIAKRFVEYRPYIWGYDLLNEPYYMAEVPISTKDWASWAQKIVDAIRTVDKQTPIIFEPGLGALPSSYLLKQGNKTDASLSSNYKGEFPILNDEKVIYSVHMYEPHLYTHQGLDEFNLAPTSTNWSNKYTYPGNIDGTYWDKKQLRKTLQPIVDFQLKHKVPIYVGEFSAIRWAGGAEQYIRDCIELFEEFGWSWTYQSFGGWHGWSIEYTNKMTSDSNQKAALASSPTEREKILRSYFAVNSFLPKVNTTKVNYIPNSGFELDTNRDGLADNWSKGDMAAVSLIKANGSFSQQVTMAADGIGIYREWIAASEKNRYLVRAKVKVDKGSVRIWQYNIKGDYKALQSTAIDTVKVTNGAYVQIEKEIRLPALTEYTSLRFSGSQGASFSVDDVEFIDLGRS